MKAIVKYFHYICYKMKHKFYCRYSKCKRCKRKIFTKDNTYLCINSGLYFTSKNNLK